MQPCKAIPTLIAWARMVKKVKKGRYENVSEEELVLRAVTNNTIIRSPELRRESKGFISALSTHRQQMRAMKRSRDSGPQRNLERATSTHLDDLNYSFRTMSYSMIIAETSYASQFFITSRGFVGKAYGSIEEGDTVVAMPGLGLSLILRRADPIGSVGSAYKLAGFAYVLGLSGSEILEEGVQPIFLR